MVFFFYVTTTPEIYPYLHTLSLHVALPICAAARASRRPFAQQGCQSVLDPASRGRRRAQHHVWRQRQLLSSAGERISHDGGDDCGAGRLRHLDPALRSEEHTSELQSLMRTSYAVF